MNLQRRPRRCRNQERSGTATVELAVCLPLLALLVFGSIQACDMIYLKHGLTTAAYEGSLELTRAGVSNDSVRGRIVQTLGLREVRDAKISFQPIGVDLATASAGTAVTIEVSAPVKPNVALSTFIPMPDNLTVEFACTK